MTIARYWNNCDEAADRNRIINRKDAGGMDLAIVQGLAAQLGFKFQKSKYEKGFPEPVDLIGKTVSLSIHGPSWMKMEVAMKLTTNDLNRRPFSALVRR